MSNPGTGLRNIDAETALVRLRNQAEMESWSERRKQEAMEALRGGYVECHRVIRIVEPKPCRVVAVPSIIVDGKRVRHPMCPEFDFGDLVLCKIEDVDEFRGLLRCAPCSPQPDMVLFTNLDGSRGFYAARNRPIFVVHASDILLTAKTHAEMMEADRVAA